jgi:hypothetical protein
MRGPAARALRLLAWLGRDETVRQIAACHGVTAYVEALLGDDRPARPAPRALSLEGLPSLRDPTGHPIDEIAVQTLLELLRATPRRPPCSALARARASLLAVDLDRFALALFDRFFARGERDHDRFLMHVPSLIGGDGAVLGLLARLPRLAGVSPEHGRVVLESIAAIATPLAVLELTSLARGAPVAGLRDDLARAIVAARVRSGQPPFGVGPEHVPDVLEGRRELVLACGDRTLHARLSGSFEVMLRDPHGRPESLPTPPDDAEVEDARARLRALGRAAELVERVLVERFEAAMERRRTFSVEVFARLCASATHAPIVSSLLFRIAPSGV